MCQHKVVNIVRQPLIGTKLPRKVLMHLCETLWMCDAPFDVIVIVVLQRMHLLSISVVHIFIITSDFCKNRRNSQLPQSFSEKLKLLYLRIRLPPLSFSSHHITVKTCETNNNNIFSLHKPQPWKVLTLTPHIFSHVIFHRISDY